MSEDRIGDILTADGLSGYLKVPKSTICKLVREGNIPARKIGRLWRIAMALRLGAGTLVPQYMVAYPVKQAGSRRLD